MSEARDLVAVDRRGAITVITLQRHEKRNAFDPELSHALDAAINEFEDDPDQWVAVLTGGPDMFSAGSDLAEGSASTSRGGEYGIIRRRRTKPMVAACEGLALGGGLGQIRRGGCQRAGRSLTGRAGVTPAASVGTIAPLVLFPLGCLAGQWPAKGP